MKTATLLRVGQETTAARWFGLLAMAVFLLGAAGLQAQTPTKTATTVTTLGGGPQIYNPGSSYGYSNSVWGALESQFHTPLGIAFDGAQNYLYVADRDNNAIRLIDSYGEIATFAPYPPYVPTNVISQPVGVAVDALSDVFVLNCGNGANGNVVEFDWLGDLIATNMTGLTNASGIALDALGDIYVTASNTVFRITSAGASNVVATINAPGASLQGIVVKRSGANAGLLAVCDSGRNGIYLINPTNGVVTTNAGFNGAGDGTGNRNQGILNSRAQFFQPTGIVEAGDGSLIVADYGNDRVKIVTASGITTNLYGVSSNDWWTGTTPSGGAAVLGWSDGAVWEPDGGPGFGNVQARMPFAVAIGPDGTIYTTEDYYHIIRKVTGANIQLPLPWPPPAPTGPIATAGYGQVSLTWNASSSATNYNVYRSSNNTNGFAIIGSTASTSYTDMNLFDGTTYYYVISALNVGGEGLTSIVVGATPLYSPTPTILTVTNFNFGPVLLTWTTSAGATSYNIYRSPNTNGFAIIGSSVSTGFSDSNAVSGTTYYYVVTAVNGGGENPASSAYVSYTPPLPPVPNPQIGWVTFPPNSTNINPDTSIFNIGSPSGNTFNNDVPIVIIGAAGSQTFYSSADTTNFASLPAPAISPPQGYVNGLTQAQVPNYTVLTPPPFPNVAVSAIGEQSGHPNSALVSALFQFVVGNPSITGDNAAQFMVNDVTSNAMFQYTTDGTDPRTNGTVIGPITATNGITLSLQFPANTNSMLFQIIGFKGNYQTSSVVSQVFSISNFVANTISFGFASGEASSDFVASPGQTFYAPVTLTTLPNTVMYSLQFNVTVNTGPTNPGPALATSPTPYGFASMLMKPIPGINPVVYEQIPPAMFVDGQSVPNPVLLDGSTDFSSLLVTNNSINLLGVGWVERAGATNLYDTTKQTLITYSMAHDDMFPNPNEPNGVIIGGYAFTVPATATNGQTYQIQIGRPSATSDGIGAPGSSVYIATPTNGSPAGGAINSIKNVTIGSLKYLVGNVYPFRWFNAGDFGNTNLQNADVEQVFEAAVYYLNSPAWQAPGSDFFDAMDSCGNIGVLDGATGYYTNTAPSYPTNFSYTITNYTYTYDINTNLISTTSAVIPLNKEIYIDTTSFTANYTKTYIYPTSTNVVPFTTTYYFPNPYVPNLFDGNDQNINQIAFGDGKLDVCDVYVTYRRSLDPSLYWFQRFWTNGIRVAETTSNVFVSGAVKQSSGGKFQPAVNSNPAPVSITNASSVNFVAGDYQTTAGQTIQIPVTASVFGPYPLRVAMVNISVVPLDGSPALTTPISFSPDTALGTPYTTASSGNGNYAAAWLDSTIAGLSNNAAIGTLTITIPANATGLSSYAVHFDHASGSPNGLASFPKQTSTGLITLSSRNASSYNDGIPDSWRLRWFGTIYNQLSVSNACPSGDGVNNWQKYVAGVDPNTPNDFPSLNPNTPPPSGAAMSIYWPTVSGKQYAILSSASLFPGSWTTNTIVTGNGANMEFDDNSGGAAKFYRVLILP